VYDRLDLALQAGRSYYVRYAVETDGVFDFEVTGPPPRPDNDDLDRAAGVGDAPFVSLVDTSAAGSEVGELPAPCGREPGHGVWYHFAPRFSRWVDLDTRGSKINTVLSVWDGAGHPLRPLGCNDDGPNLIDVSALKMYATGGQVYLIKVEGTGHRGGVTVLNVQPDPRAVWRAFLPLLW
jgi:hypothetical protein